MNEDTSYLCSVTIKRHHLHDTWKSLRMMIKNKWTVASDDDAFLMEIMSDLARFDTKDGKEDIKLVLPFTKMKACWTAIKFLLDHKWVPLEGQPTLLEALALMGTELQRIVNEVAPETAMNTPPDQLNALEVVTVPKLRILE
jgi:hypothetical protein